LTIRQRQARDSKNSGITSNGEADSRANEEEMKRREKPIMNIKADRREENKETHLITLCRFDSKGETMTSQETDK
jgi:hypothetical protein